jgi:hypothetical protein
MKAIVRRFTDFGLALKLRNLPMQRDVASAGNYRVGPTAQRPSTRRTLTMSWLSRCLHLPASETQKTFLLVFCIVAMSVMAVGLVWQAEIIANQREAIRWLQSGKLGG